jgi:hypothetical protein
MGLWQISVNRGFPQARVERKTSGNRSTNLVLLSLEPLPILRISTSHKSALMAEAEKEQHDHVMRARVSFMGATRAISVRRTYAAQVLFVARNV